uniref:Ig-like domain-containing protein n=1 Tax=Stieleria sp. TaxID=2795976 RepID=UPI003562B090
TVTASDGDGGFDRSVTRFDVLNTPPYRPTISAPVPGPHYTGVPIELSARDVTDDGAGDSLEYLWEVTTNNGQAVESSDKIDFSFTPQYSGRYSVQLTVTDSDGGVSSFDPADYDVIPTARISDGGNGWLTFDGSQSIALPEATLSGASDITVELSIRTNQEDLGLLEVVGSDGIGLLVGLVNNATTIRVITQAQLPDQPASLIQHTFDLAAPLSDNQWHRITIVRNAVTGQTELFIDGLSVGVRDLPLATDTLPKTSYAVLNVTSVRVGDGLRGSLDNVQIWQTARSEDQIAINDAVEIRRSEGLVGWWALNELAGDTAVIDQSGRGNHGQFVTGAEPTRNRTGGEMRLGDTITLSGAFSTPIAPAGDLRGKTETVRREYHWFVDDVRQAVTTTATYDYAPAAAGAKAIKLIVVDIFETVGDTPVTQPTTAELCALDNERYTVLCSDEVSSTLQVGEQAIGITPAVATADEGDSLDFSFNSVLPLNEAQDVIKWTATLEKGGVAIWQTDGNGMDFNVTPPDDGTLTINLSVTTSTDSVCRVYNAPPLTIAIENVAPTANEDRITTAADSAVTITTASLLANDTDPGVFDTLTISSHDVATALFVSLVDNPDGSIVFDPTTIADIQTLAHGESRGDTFHYTIEDSSGASHSAIVSLTIEGVNDTPVPTADGITVQIKPDSVSGSGNVLGNDSDIDTTDTLSVARFGDRVHDSQDFVGTYGALTWNRNGSFTYQADMTNPLVRGLLATDTLSEEIPYVVTDGIAEVESSLTVALEGTNRRPTDIAISATSFNENASGVVIGDLTVTDQDVNDVFRFTVSDDRFVVVGGQLKLADGLALNHEIEPTVSVDVDVFDFGNQTFRKTLNLIVTDVNEQPSVVDQAFAVDENSPLETPVGTVAATDVDQGDTLTFSIIGGSGRDAFRIDSASGAITVANSGLLDFESGPTMTLEIEVVDAGTLKDAATITISINDVDETPAPQLERVAIDDGSGQRSAVRYIDLQFDSLVTIDDGAFQLATSDGTPVGVAPVIDHINGKTKVRLTFLDPASGADLVDDSGSLQDGNYTLTILDTHVRSATGKRLDGDRDGEAGAPRVDEFFRFFGDTDGDRDVDGQDYGRFGLSFLKSNGDAAYNPALDSDGDGDVDGQDYGRFGLRFLKRLGS